MNKTRVISILCSIMLALAATGGVAQAMETQPQAPSSYANADDELQYDVVFPQDAVNTITITVSPENWKAMQEDMTTLFGAFGAGERRNGGRPPGGGGGVGGGDFTEENPMWAPVNITFNGETWANVGMRYKGNSSLAGAWRSGSLKLGFKLNFDRFEDDFPEIKNQRFYGFDELSFSSNWRDTSYLHEKVAADIFRAAGVPAAQTAFYAVTLDYGEGPIYVGLYTAVEVIEDTVIRTQFSDGSGNLYKPEGTGASFQAGTFDKATFSKETNEDEANYSDILALFAALHDTSRTTDPAAWRAKLEAVLNVDGFVHWLAVNTVIQNWDVYGTMAHNYYLYNDPATGLLNWLPWDNNEALSSRSGRRGGNNGALNLAGVNNSWPLIRYVIDDPVYQKLYVRYVEDTVNGAFEPTKMETTFTTWHNLIRPYVVGDGDGQAADKAFTTAQAFDSSLTELINHAKARYKAAQDYIAQQ